MFAAKARILTCLNGIRDGLCHLSILDICHHLLLFYIFYKTLFF